MHGYKGYKAKKMEKETRSRASSNAYVNRFEPVKSNLRDNTVKPYTHQEHQSETLS